MRGNLKSLFDYRAEIRDFGLGKTSAMEFPNTIMHSSAGFLSLATGAKAFNLSLSAGAASAVEALLRAEYMLEAGLCDYCLCIASEDVSFELLAFLEGDSELETSHPDPFGSQRAGYALGEAAVALLCERPHSADGRHVIPQAELLGSSTMYCADRPEHYEQLIHTALRDAGQGTKDIALVVSSANGSQTDKFEADAIFRVFGASVPVTAPKGTFGDCGAAAVLLAMISTIYTRNHNSCPPTLGRSPYDPALPPLNLIRTPRRIEGDVVLLTSLEFGSPSGALVMSMPPVVGRAAEL
jgi:3-oxoacyl-[acyl-carrier-protein] synthase II